MLRGATDHLSLSLESFAQVWHGLGLLDFLVGEGGFTVEGSGVCLGVATMEQFVLQMNTQCKTWKIDVSAETDANQSFFCVGLFARRPARLV